MRAADLILHCFQKRHKKFGEVLPTVHLFVKYGSIYILGPSIPGLVTDIQVNVYWYYLVELSKLNYFEE